MKTVIIAVASSLVTIAVIKIVRAVGGKRDDL